MDRNEAIAAIKKALKTRVSFPVSVTGGRGTAWGRITITAAPRVADQWGNMTPEQCAELGTALGFDRPAHLQGVMIAASSDYRREYVDRANGRQPAKIAEPYWD
jgi:hypothetical protein